MAYRLCRSFMNVLTYVFRTVIVIAIGVLLTPERAMAQGAAGGVQTAPGFIAAGPVVGQDTGGVVGNVAVGVGATSAASGGDGTAIGHNAVASGAEGPTAVGAGSIASGDDAVAVG